jgi:hypothetical protein
MTLDQIKQKQSECFRIEGNATFNLVWRAADWYVNPYPMPTRLILKVRLAAFPGSVINQKLEVRNRYKKRHRVESVLWRHFFIRVAPLRTPRDTQPQSPLPRASEDWNRCTGR